MNEPYLLEKVMNSKSKDRKKQRKRKGKKKETQVPAHENEQGTRKRVNNACTLFLPGWDINVV
jgi:ribosome assembly protein YihI (activator of Der GTPase)